MRRQSMEQEKIFENDVTHKGLIHNTQTAHTTTQKYTTQ